MNNSPEKKKNPFSQFLDSWFAKEDGWITMYIAIVLIIAIVVNLSMQIPIPTLSSLSSSDWLAFWGSYLGGALGCFPAMAALQHSHKESARQHEETRTDRRLSVMPVFDCQISAISRFIEWDVSSAAHIGMNSDGTLKRISEYDEPMYDCNSHISRIELSNCGLGPALQVRISHNSSSVDINLLNNNSTRYYAFEPHWQFFKKHQSKHPDAQTITLGLTFMDIFGNHYTQTQILEYSFCADEDGDYIHFRTISIGQPTLHSTEPESHS
ncbi:MAG: hypothetical protein IJE22_08600 [Oscillibacter sp.]|nr:hypothetical protein [Oscillibacter sp.]